MVGLVLGDRFELERRVGSGGMGTVYRGRDRATGATVAVKLLERRAILDEQRFLREARILADLTHPSIVRYVGHGSSGGNHYLAMEWLDGEDLEQRIEREPLRLAETLIMIRRSAEALAHAHQHGVVHRDIKPQNFFLPGGRVERIKLIDFGIARLNASGTRLTRTGTLIGTPGYMPPEVIQGAREIDGRADVFGLGCVAFECVTGRPAYVGTDPSLLMAKIVLDDTPYLRDFCADVPDAVADLVARMMAKEVGPRPDARGVLALLDSVGEVVDLPTAGRARRTVRLTIGERRIGCIVMVGPRPSALLPAAQSAVGATSVVAFAPALPPDVSAMIVEAFGASVYPLPNGSVVITLPSDGRNADVPTLAARCALAIRDELADVQIVVASGIGRFGDEGARGPVVETAVRLLKTTPRGHVRIDADAADLLGAQFEIHRSDEGLFLRRERELREARRNLLGKPVAFMGRGQELSALAGAYTDAVTEDEAHATLVIGPPGIGKSRLMHEFLDWIGKRNDRTAVLCAVGDPLAAGGPFAMLGQLVRARAGIRAGDGPEERRRKLQACVARTVAPELCVQVTVFLSEIAGVPFPDQALEALRHARANPQTMADATRRAFEEWLRSECAAQPVLLVLEDLQWGDQGTVGLIDGALRNLRDRPLMVLALARPEVATAFPHLWSERRLHQLRLGGLSRKAADKIAREALGAGASDALVASLIERADGNPLFLEELIRAAHDGRVDGLPPSVLGVIQARLDAEGESAKRVLRAAAVFGERFSVHGVAALLGGEDEAVSVEDWLGQLARREFVAVADAGSAAAGAHFTFAHSLVRDAAYAMLTDEDRVLGHRLAGEWLEATACDDAVVLAEHFRRGEAFGRAAPWYGRAAEQALKANDLAGAVAHGEAGLEALAAPGVDASDETRGTLWLTLAEARLWRGELARAEQAGRAALAALAPASAAWLRAAGQTIVALGKQGRLDPLVDLLAEVRARPAPRAGRDAFVVCLGWAASYLVIAGRHDETRDVLAQAVSVTGALERLDPLAQALIWQVRYALDGLTGDMRSALADLEAALAAFEQAGDVRNACAVRANMGFTYAEIGALEQANAVMREALAAAEKLGLVETAAVVRHNLGRVLGWRGELAEGERLERDAVSAFDAQGDPRLAGLARVYLSEILSSAGRFDAALAEAEAAARLLAASPGAHPLALAAIAEALLGQGRRDDALAASRESFDRLTAMGAIEEGEAKVRLVHAECLAAAGSAAEAARVLADARERLLARAARVGDRHWRDALLHGVPAHARTMALAESLVQAIPLAAGSSSA